MMFKKWIAVLSALVLTAACCVPMSAAAEGELYSYEVLADGTARITAYNETFTDGITTLSVPAEIDGYTVSVIGDCAFLRAFYLRCVILPDTVKVIERSAFQESGIEQIFLPEGLEEIGENAFYWCSLQTLVVPSTVTVIGEQAIGYTCLPADSEDGDPIIPGVSGLDEDFVLYVQDNETAVAYAEENGVTYRNVTDMTVGDVDLNGVVNTADARMGLGYILAGYTGKWYTGDMNGDGEMTTVDIRLLLSRMVA